MCYFRRKSGRLVSSVRRWAGPCIGLEGFKMRALIMSLAFLPCGHFEEVKPLDRTKLRVAIRFVESNHDYYVFGDGGQAWGAYQFHKLRWVELGGKVSFWGNKAVPTVYQDTLMEKALKWYIRKCPTFKGGDKALVIWCANFHNRGHGSFMETRYTQKVLNEYLRLVMEECQQCQRVRTLRLPWRN